MIFSNKAKQKKELLKNIADTKKPADIAQTLTLVDLARRYKSTINNVNLDEAKEPELTSIKKY